MTSVGRNFHLTMAAIVAAVAVTAPGSASAQDRGRSADRQTVQRPAPAPAQAASPSPALARPAIGAPVATGRPVVAQTPARQVDRVETPAMRRQTTVVGGRTIRDGRGWQPYPASTYRRGYADNRWRGRGYGTVVGGSAPAYYGGSGYYGGADYSADAYPTDDAAFVDQSQVSGQVSGEVAGPVAVDPRATAASYDAIASDDDAYAPMPADMVETRIVRTTIICDGSTIVTRERPTGAVYSCR
jgi:hypothetical protein